MEEELYRMPGARRRRGLADEIGKFALCFAFSRRDQAPSTGRPHKVSGLDIAEIKSAILSQSIGAGDEIEGEGVLSRFAAVYSPRAYYPSYFLGEMRAELRAGAGIPSASAHYLPVSCLPPLPDGYCLSFLFPVDKTEFERPDFPSNIRDVMTRDYLHFPLVSLPDERVEGRIRFKARLRQLSRETMHDLAGVGEKPYESYSARGLTYYLEPLEVEATGREQGLRGSLFAEMAIPGNPGWHPVAGILESLICQAVEAVFPRCERGERQELTCYLPQSGHQVVRFRRRLFGLVYDPVVVLFRAPNLLGLYLPCDLRVEIDSSARLFEDFVAEVAGRLETELQLDWPLTVEIAYDNRAPWARARGALESRSFRMVSEDYP